MALDGTVYNVATDEEISILDLVSMIGSKLDIYNPQFILRDIVHLILSVGF